METFLNELLTNGGPAGIAVVVAVLSIGWVARHNGWLFNAAKKSDPPAADSGAVERRLTQLESEVRQLPTRQELHELQLKFTTLATEMKGMAATASATQNAVLRIETFMIEASQRDRGRSK